MSYSKQTWADAPSITTPLDATRLGHIEDGIEAAANAADAAAAAVTAEATARAAAITAAIASLVNAAPGALDTLKELADALGDDANAYATLVAAIALKAPLASPTLTGHPTGVTEAPGDNSMHLASTAYADAAVSVEASARQAAITAEAMTRANAITNESTTRATNDGTEAAARIAADSAEASARATADALLAPLASPGFTGVPTAPTAVLATSTIQVATTAFVAAAIANLINAAPGALDSLKELADAIGDDPNFSTTLATAMALKAPLASPVFTGHPTGVTETASDNSTRLSTTAYADAAVAVETAARGAAVTSEATARSNADALLAPLASPALTGHPTGVTEAPLNNSTRLASTAYADAAVAVETAARGTAVTSEATARTNADALLAPLASPVLTGNPTAPTQAPGNSSTRLANMAAMLAAVASGVLYGQHGSAGCLAATYSRHVTIQNVGVAANSSGRHRVFAIWLPAGLSISNISFFSGTTAGAALTHQWFSLSDSSRTVLAVTADDGATAWSASSKKTLAITGGPFVTTYTGLYYVGCLVTSTTTQPNHEGVNTATGAGARSYAPLLGGDTDTGLTTPIAVGTVLGTITLQQILFYCELS